MAGKIRRHPLWLTGNSNLRVIEPSSRARIGETISGETQPVVVKTVFGDDLDALDATAH